MFFDLKVGGFQLENSDFGVELHSVRAEGFELERFGVGLKGLARRTCHGWRSQGANIFDVGIIGT